EKLDELERDLEGEGMRAQLVVTLDSLSKVIPGDSAELWFDPASMHIFDPETGENLTRDEGKAQEIEEESRQLRQRALERAQRKVNEAPQEQAQESCPRGWRRREQNFRANHTVPALR